MLWSPQQESTLQQVDRWIRTGDTQVFHLFGYAGTGKTTLAKHIAAGVSGQVIFAAFTGKAASVLQSKGCDNAMTIHSLIYHSRDKGKTSLVEMEQQLQKLLDELAEEGMTEQQIESNARVKDLKSLVKAEREHVKQPFFVLNQESDIRGAKLVIIDECSMVDAKMGEDLLSFGVKVLVLGDPAQLPPVKGSGYFTSGVTPQVMLDEIHRQAAESPIIRMATEIRNERKLTIGDYGDGCSFIDEKVSPELALGFDQILVGKNVTRFATNKRVRTLKGYEEPLPVAGERIVCKRNNHDSGLLNGVVYEVLNNNGSMDDKSQLDIVIPGSKFAQEVMAHNQGFLTSKDDIPFYELRDAEVFEYGYAMTVHTAQGSQWDSVLLFDESFCFRKDKWKWLYTGITRAAERLTIVRM